VLFLQSTTFDHRLKFRLRHFTQPCVTRRTLLGAPLARVSGRHEKDECSNDESEHNSAKALPQRSVTGQTFNVLSPSEATGEDDRQDAHHADDPSCPGPCADGAPTARRPLL
jgi:hypothetical protein